MNRVHTLHPVYRSMNKPLTIWGAERRLFLLALVIGAGMFNFFGSLLGGLLMFGALYRRRQMDDRHRSPTAAHRAELGAVSDALRPGEAHVFPRRSTSVNRLDTITVDYRDAGALNALLNLVGFIGDGVFLTKSGAVGLVVTIGGLDDECLDAARREQVVLQFAHSLRLFDERFRIYQYLLKRRLPDRGDTGMKAQRRCHAVTTRTAFLSRQRAVLRRHSLRHPAGAEP